MKPIIEVNDLVKTYSSDDVQVKALRGVSLAIMSGEFLMVMGKSGSGKSTLMHILGCLDRATSGSVSIDGHETSTLTQNELADLRNRKLGFVFQSFNLLSRTTSLNNVAMPLIYAGVSKQERTARAAAVLSAVDLTDKINVYSSKLSGGQQQRVAIARAIVTNPAIIMADEPTGNLDTHSGLEIMTILQDLSAQGKTIIMVTHEPDIAMFGTRIITLKDGLIVQDKPNIPKSARELLLSCPQV